MCQIYRFFIHKQDYGQSYTKDFNVCTPIKLVGIGFLGVINFLLKVQKNFSEFNPHGSNAELTATLPPIRLTLVVEFFRNFAKVWLFSPHFNSFNFNAFADPIRDWDAGRTERGFPYA